MTSRRTCDSRPGDHVTHAGRCQTQKSRSVLRRPACRAPGSRIWTSPYAGTLRLLSHASIARGSKRRRPATLRYGIRPARHRRRMLSGCCPYQQSHPVSKSCYYTVTNNSDHGLPPCGIPLQRRAGNGLRLDEAQFSVKFKFWRPQIRAS